MCQRENAGCPVRNSFRQTPLWSFVLPKTAFDGGVCALLCPQRCPLAMANGIFEDGFDGWNRVNWRLKPCKRCPFAPVFAPFYCTLCRMTLLNGWYEATCICTLSLALFPPESFVSQNNAATERQWKSICRGFSPCRSKTSGVSFAPYALAKGRMLKIACTLVDF